jgi:uncharacterized LabA/DUF88 family protein
MQRVLFLADVSNLYFTVQLRHKAAIDYERYLRIGLDYVSYRDSTQPTCNLAKAIAYGANGNTEQSASFQSTLRRFGWATKYKQPNEWKDPETGKITRKADWDVGIAVDAVRLMTQYDKLVLGSADGDFTPLVEYLQESDREVFIYACGISTDLKNSGASWCEVGKEVFRE